ncbi:glycosyltransferase [Thermodesulfovibrio yellowstonii]|uniref:Glycosyltransferase n=1 Tax=Thermodesulfovibrio yellowstonii (strain ATCC 51303 / DSM 11347 / YP87) TaxID=289376 RepID=B5YJC3_THEYD|nr:glycosyltransferase [Thermodesulfovibrio yellowstonii]ACI21148.1 glycosyltransferase [Thermodesulfovibrio yellowstonii DSM 11347]
MKILFITQNFPYPPYKDGSRLISYNLIKYLSQNNEVYLITFCEEEDIGYIDKIKIFCSNLLIIPLIKGELTPLKKIKQNIRKIITPKRFSSKLMYISIQKIANLWKPDIVHIDLPMMSQYYRAVEKLPKIISSHDAISLNAYKIWKNTLNPFKKVKWFYLYKQRKWIESHYYPKFHACTVVSEEDKSFLSKHCPDLYIEVIPNGVDTEYFSPDLMNNIPSQDFTIGLFGNFIFPPNEDGALYFTSKIYPLIKNKIPDVKLYIIGRNPTKKIKSLANNQNIIITGEVSDIREYYLKVSVVVAPFRLGSGIKNTVLQAMSMARPIVATFQAVKAIEVLDGEHLLIADNISMFADKVIFLLKNKMVGEKLGKLSRELVIKKYSWKSHAENFQKLYKKIINSCYWNHENSNY